MHYYQRELTSRGSCLFIIPFHYNPTLQLQWSTSVIVTPFIQISHFNHFQSIHILNLNRWIIGEWIATNLQFSQLRTILQIEMTSRIITPTILKLRETVHSNHHSLQLRQANQMHLIHIRKAVVTHYQLFQIHKSRQIQYSEGCVITTIHDNPFHSRSQCIEFLHRMNSRMEVIIDDRMIC